MIKNISLHNFKCFKDITIQARALNICAGMNSAGKSTFIQSLLLIRQSYGKEHINSKGILLNGPYTQIGRGKDLLNFDAEDSNIGIIIQNDQKGIFDWNAKYKAEADFLDAEYKYSKGADLNLLSQNFEYISAERIGPRNSYESSYSSVILNNSLGPRGEFAANYLLKHSEDKIANKSLINSNSSSKTLSNQTDAWIDELVPNIKLRVNDYSKADLVGLNVESPSPKGPNSVKVTNVGFGITYVLPVIMALLKAKGNEILIIENPEAHLHPRGQMKLGEMIARASLSGTQIFVETHSDHILNGLRLAVKNNIVKSSDIQLNYFSYKNYLRSLESPKIQSDGRLDFWPDGFFDEWDKAIDKLF